MSPLRNATLQQWFARLPLGRKLVILISGVSFAAVTLSMLASFVIELGFFRSRLLQEYEVSARIISYNLEAAVEFEEPLDANETLSALHQREFVRAAGVYLADGRLLADYRQPGDDSAADLPAPDAASELRGDFLVVNEPVLVRGVETGRFVLLADVGEIRSFLAGRAWIFLALIIVACAIAALLAKRLGSRLSQPIVALANTARRITDDHDFSTRQQRLSDDETGQLVDAFNEMMAEIEKREDAILQAKERAEASNRAKDDFLSIISHELRTPLNPIIGYVEILHRRIQQTEDRKQLQLVKQYAEHLQSLIDGVIDYSRFERGVVSLSRDRVDYCRMGKNVIALLQRNAEKKGISLEAEFPCADGETDPPCVIFIDRVKLQQIILNLVSNAIKFTERGHVRLRSQLNPYSPSQRLLRIEVADTGIGIAEEDRNKVFKPFSQIDESLTRQYSGMGLGLAISRKIARAMGGDIDFASVKGEGSVFWLEIPVELSDDPEPDPEPAEPPPPPHQADGRARVLLVDDQLVNLELGTSMLESSGHEVVCARSGAEAVEIARQERFSLIILDIKMPRMNGYETAKALREIERDLPYRTPIIAMTAHVTTRGNEECFEAGMDDFLPKPFNTAKLRLITQKWLGLAPTEDEPRPRDDS